MIRLKVEIASAAPTAPHKPRAGTGYQFSLLVAGDSSRCVRAAAGAGWVVDFPHPKLISDTALQISWRSSTCSQVAGGSIAVDLTSITSELNRWIVSG